MVITDMNTLAMERICLNPAECTEVLGKLGENGIPGQAVVKDESLGTWMLADISDTSKAIAFTRIGIIDYRKRVNPSTMALKTITSAYVYNSAGDKLVPIVTSGVCCAYCEDINTDWPAGGDLMMSTTAGSLRDAQIEDTTHTVAGGAVIRAIVASAAARIADGDTKCIIGLGRDYGRIWGGINRVGG